MDRVLRFLVKVALMAGVFYGVTYLLNGIQVIPNPNGPLGEPGTYLWIALIFALVNAVVGPVLRLLSFPFVQTLRFEMGKTTAVVRHGAIEEVVCEAAALTASLTLKDLEPPLWQGTAPALSVARYHW